jgi:hypothetical protein
MATAVALASPAAHANDASAERCPPEYWTLKPVCINQSSGDAVKASSAAPSPVADEQRWPR